MNKATILFSDEQREEIISEIQGVDLPFKCRFDSLDVYIGLHYAIAEVSRRYASPVKLSDVACDASVMLKRYLCRIEAEVNTIGPDSYFMPDQSKMLISAYAKQISKLPVLSGFIPTVVRQFRNTPKSSIVACYMRNGDVLIEVEYPDDCDYWR